MVALESLIASPTLFACALQATREDTVINPDVIDEAIPSHIYPIVGSAVSNTYLSDPAYVTWGRVSPSATGLGSFFVGVDVPAGNGLVTKPLARSR